MSGCGCENPDTVRWVLGKVRCRNCQACFTPVKEAKKPVRNSSRSTRRQADKQEKRVAAQVGGRQTIASGQTPVDKGDVRSDRLRIECKYTDSKSFTLKAEDLEKVANQATGNQIPLFYIEYRERPGAGGYYVVPEHWFLQMLEGFK